MASISKIKDLGKEFPLNAVVKEIVGEDSSGQRIDNFLIKRLKGVPKSHIYRLLRSGQVRVNSKRIGADYHLDQGDTVRIPPVRRPPEVPKGTNKITKSRLISFEVLFQDESILAINKPAGVAVHGGSGVSFGVIEQLRARHPDWNFLELVHRLDRETSGVLLLAKKRPALVALHQQIREGLMEKRYLVLVKGRWCNPKQSVKMLLHKYVTASGERRVEVTSDEKMGMSSHTVFTLQKSWQDFCLLEAELKTGRTHQIRVHLSHLGFPVVGDDKYGDFALNKRLAKSTQKSGLGRMFLHALTAVVKHPVSGEQLRIEAPLANDLQKFLDRLDEDGGGTSDQVVQ